MTRTHNEKQDRKHGEPHELKGFATPGVDKEE